MSGAAVTVIDERELAVRVRAAAVLVERVELAEALGEGLVATVHLDPLLVDARAGQQGLPDRSVAAAARHPRVQRVIEGAIAQANAGCATGQRIVRYEIAG